MSSQGFSFVMIILCLITKDSFAYHCPNFAHESVVHLFLGRYVFLALSMIVQCGSYVYDQLHTYVSILKKVRNTSCSALILFLINPQDSEVSKMVCIAIVVRTSIYGALCFKLRQFRGIHRNVYKN